MGKRYSERHTKESPAWPFDLGLGPTAHHVVVKDLKTGVVGEGWDWDSEKEAREKAWRDLREKQGN